jgi:hypothetical protein
MSLETNTEIDRLSGRAGDSGELQNPAGDINGGVEAAIGDVGSVTLYLSTAGAVDVAVEASPDGDNWFTLPESPISFDGAADDMILINYDVARLRLTGSDTTDVQAILREVV